MLLHLGEEVGVVQLVQGGGAVEGVGRVAAAVHRLGRVVAADQGSREDSSELRGAVPSYQYQLATSMAARAGLARFTEETA